MYPSLLAEETKRAVTEYLSTTFALADDDARAALESFLLDRDTGIFRGPYLRVRTPFHPVPRGWRSPLGWLPRDFRPYVHQAQAFERLSTRDSPAQPTIVTTGTGSGKTEAFLFPLLDHAARAKARGETGIKAILLYPMNALVTDQARRIAELLHDEPHLREVTAGVYIGGEDRHSEASRDHLVTSRRALREQPPDLLLTNYKMLDLLLLRADDAPLWAQSRTSLQFLVLDEFHTYDGAQGTDVAMLLRRLGATLKVAEAGRPLGRVTPVATSATLGGSTRPDALRAFAETVFEVPFPPESVITEERLEAADVVSEIDFELPVPEPADLAELPLPESDRDGSWRRLAHAFLGGAIPDQLALGRKLRQSFLTRAVVQTLADHPLTLTEAVDAVCDAGVLRWGLANQRTPDAVEQALLRFLALLSAARADAGPGRTRPFLHVEVQLWVRELTRMLRAVDRTPRFAWWHDAPADDVHRFLPAAYCRVCGRSGWVSMATELGETLEGSATSIWRASIGDRRKLRTVLPAGHEEPGARLLDPLSLAFVGETADGPADRASRDINAADLPDPTEEPGAGAEATSQGPLPVLVTPDAKAAEAQRCPACDSDDAIRFLGSSVATLLSVALTQLFGSDLVGEREKKTLVFTDSVQDAAHRAAFIEGRSFQFNLRSAVLRATGGVTRSLEQVARELAASETDDLYAIAPPDFVQRLGLEGEWLRTDRKGRLRSLLGTRLAFQTHLEVGLRSRLGRTLELTGALGVDIDLDLEHHAGLARATHENLPERGLGLPSSDAYRQWILGLLDRLRRRGGIVHREWLATYISRDGKRWPISVGSPRGMLRFGLTRGPAPIFFTTSTKSDFDSLRSRDTWLVRWTQKCLEMGPVEARALLEHVIRDLSEGEDPPLLRFSSQSDASVFGLDPARILLTPLEDGHLGDTQLHCPACHHLQPVAPGRFEEWRNAPCPGMRCPGRLEPYTVREDNFYRALYRSGRLRHLVTHEHTALLDDSIRQHVERRFAQGDSVIDPNVLTCTPTLELGIDIGDLSTVGLASLPRGPANYLQRVGRAGRSTGNALVLATVPSGPRDLYYLSEPKHLIDGEVVPPAAYLAATELLCRQYLAFCLDRTAAGDIPLHRDLPQRLGILMQDGLEPGTWLRQFVDTVTKDADRLAQEFLELYGPRLDSAAQQAVRRFAATGLRDAVARTVAEWRADREEHQRRIHELTQAVAELDRQGHLDDSQLEDHRRWSGESKALNALLGKGASRETLTGLGELGLLPGYNLRDDNTELDVSLWWTTDDEGSRNTQTSDHSYARGSRNALTEFAPGAVFYAQGYRVQIDALEVGPSGQPHWRHTRLCPDCGWGTETVDPAPVSCPRCGGTGVGDTGAVHQVLELRRVSAVHRRDDALIEDEAEDRTRIRFDTVTGVDVEPTHIKHAWRLRDQVFGAEYVRQATIRTINKGRSGRTGPDTAIAGDSGAAERFPTCAYCGVVRLAAEDKVRHRGWCSSRRGTPVRWENLLLSHRITTQAVRLLLPVSTFHVKIRLTSFKAALLLGLRIDFGGDPQHLDVVTARMPDEHRRTRQFLVLHDTVPGGTGYLDRFGHPEQMRRILGHARHALESCPCRNEDRKACHRCLLGVLSDNEVESADREVALDLLAELLDDWTVENIGSVTAIDISAVRLSELELRFREVLKEAVDRLEGQSWSGAKGNHGEELDIRLLGPNREPRRWTVRPQVDIRAGGVTTRPDFLLTRQDAQDAQVAVYLDGKAFHASAGLDRTADDARKRAALREEGLRVWSLTWEDVEDFARRLDGYDSRLDPLVEQTAANQALTRIGDPGAAVLWGNPMEALLAYLRDPGEPVWGQAAVQTCLALLETGAPPPGPAFVACTPGRLAEVLVSWASGFPPATGPGELVVAFRSGRSRLPIAIVGNGKDDDVTESLGAVVILDDRPSEVGGSAHDGQWRDWLRWSNLLQFLRLPRHGPPMPLRMFECWTRRSVDDFRIRTLPLAAGATEASTVHARDEDPALVAGLADTGIQADVLQSDWRIAIDYTDHRLEPIGRRLAGLHLPAPEAGGEVGESELWQVEYCWPDEQVAVVVDADEARDGWLTGNGWRVLRYPEDGTEEDLVNQIVAAFRRVER